MPPTPSQPPETTPFPSWLPPRLVQLRHDSQFFHHLGTFGYPFHLWLAALWCLLIVGPMATVELSGVAVVICFLARLPFIYRGLFDALRQPAVICLTLWCLWGWILAAADGFRPQALHELAFQRWAYAFIVLWAVLDNRRVLIVALCAGFAAAQGAQLLEFLGHHFNLPQLIWSHPPSPDPASRISGWWHQPAIGGVMLVACLGLHIGPALLATGRVRAIAITASLATIIALLATGTRGAWLAGAMLVIIVLLLALAVRVRAGTAKPILLTLAAIVVLTTLAAFALEAPRRRITLLVTEMREVLTRDNLDSDMGGRVLAARAALNAITQRPLTGVGPGNFHAHVNTYAQQNNLQVADFRLEKLKTAHNTFLHTAATQGLIGALLLYTAIALALIAGLFPRTTSPRPALAAHLATYNAAPALALLGIVLAGLFETTPINTSTAALSTVLFALCAHVRPREVTKSI